MFTISEEVADFLALIETEGPWFIVAEDAVDLRNLNLPNNIFVLQLSNAPMAVGGGRVVKAYHYAIGKGECVRVAKYEDELRLEGLEVPSWKAALAIILPDGK